MQGLERGSVCGIAAAARAASVSACRRRRAMGEPAGALLVALTTWPALARAAPATALSSWAGTAGLTRTTALTPFIASSMLAGTSRSPAATSAPAPASAFTAAFAGSRTSTRTGSCRSRSRRTVSERPSRPSSQGSR